MIWVVLCIVGLVLLHFVPRDSVRETMAATLVCSSLGVWFLEQVAHLP